MATNMTQRDGYEHEHTDIGRVHGLDGRGRQREHENGYGSEGVYENDDETKSASDLGGHSTRDKWDC
jgi:hypothetical protein